MTNQTLKCSCGQVAYEIAASPIVSAICHCDDCQAAGVQLEALPLARPIRDAFYGTPYVLYRKDRVKLVTGAELIRARKLEPGSPTNRIIATCCNTALLVSFDNAIHWVSVYRSALGRDAPEPTMRLQTRFQPVAMPLPDTPPAYSIMPAAFVFKLIGARIAMLFG